MLLSSTMNGVAARSNFMLLRMPSHPSAPLNAVDFTALPDCATSIQPSADKVILQPPDCGGAFASKKPAKLSGDFGARSGGAGSFASANGTSATIVPKGIGNVTLAPEAIFGRSVPLSVARSLSSGHLNLSQPTGSCANAGTATIQAARAMNAVFTT